MSLSGLLRLIRTRKKQGINKNKTEEQQGFNVIVEGSYSGVTKDAGLKIMRFEVHEDAASINDGEYRYVFYGKTDDFENIKKVPSEVSGLEVKINPLSSILGIVLEARTVFLPRPRTVYIRDGRIFVEEYMRNEESYMSAVVPSTLTFAGKVFANRETAEIFDDWIRKIEATEEENRHLYVEGKPLKWQVLLHP